MSRIIKFRVWNHIEKVYEPYYDMCNGPFICLHGHYKPVAKGSFSPITLEQFTGLLDKDGKEIYEGDIVQRIWIFPKNDFIYRHGEAPSGHYVEKPNLIGVIEYESSEACFKIVNRKNAGVIERGSFSWCKRTDARGTVYKILGNVHENPELLKP